eukprot:scaffold746_cov112-Isochrysis_galbana.AAC.7
MAIRGILSLVGPTAHVPSRRDSVPPPPPTHTDLPAVEPLARATLPCPKPRWASLYQAPSSPHCSLFNILLN